MPIAQWAAVVGKGLTVKGHEAYSGHNENVLYADCDVGCITMHICQISPNSTLQENKFYCI